MVSDLSVVLFLGFFIFVLVRYLFLFNFQRVARYRGKMKKKMAENKILDDKIQDMKMYEGGLGRAGKDEEINMIANPMVVKFKSLQEQLREYKDTTGYYDQQSKKQKSRIENLEGQRKKLNDAVNNLKMQLEEHRNRIQAQKKLREQQAAVADRVNREVENIQSPQNHEVQVEDIPDPDDDEDGPDLGREQI